MIVKLKGSVPIMEMLPFMMMGETAFGQYHILIKKEPVCIPLMHTG